jgi:hypothetical protein
LGRVPAENACLNQSADLGLTETRLTQDLAAVLADPGRLSRKLKPRAPIAKFQGQRRQADERPASE